MNINSLPFILFLFVFFFSTSHISAQDYYASNDIVTPEKISSVYRLQKRLSAVYTGYAIEVVTSEFPIKRTHPIYEQFGKIYYQKLKEGGYSYLIKAQFKDLKSVRQFSENVIEPKVSIAKIFQYKKGKRKLRQ